MYKTRIRFILKATAVTSLFFATLPAMADIAVDAAQAGLEEIVVTARKTSEPLQTTPVAVTALSSTSLVQQQIFDVGDLGHAAPDIAIGGAGTGPSSIVYLAIRGEAQNSPNSASDNSVGIYIDGVYIARPIIGNQGFLDMNQVEVLRGPQGTLFGRNTTGGALNLTTNQPTDTFGGYVKGGYGDYSSKLGEAVVNLPIMAGELDSRIAVRFDNHNSYFTNPIDPQFDPSHLYHDWQARAQLKWTPSAVPSLVIDWMFDYADERDSGTPTAVVGFNGTSNIAGPINLAGLFGLVGVNPASYMVNPYSNHNPNYRFSFGGIPTDVYAPASNINTPSNANRANGFSQNLDLDVGTVHVKSITAYRWSDTSNGESLSGMPINFYAFYSQYIEHQFSEELQLSGKAGKFDWIGGAYYFTEGGSELSDSQAFGFLTPLFNSFGVVPQLAPQPVNSDYSTFSARSIAAFGQTNYHITDTVRATVGYRYTWDVRDLDQSGRNNLYGDSTCAVGVTSTPAAVAAGLAYAPFACTNPYTASFSYPAWTAGLDWEVMPDTFLYVKTDKASMAGGFNTRPVVPGVNPAFGPESNMDVEAGVKTDQLDHTLRTNLAVFHGWQSNVQRIENGVVYEAGLPEATQQVVNAGKTRTYGAELEITALPWRGMEINLSGAYLHAAYVPGTFSETQILPDGTAVKVDRSNETVPQAPRFTASIGGTQTVPLDFGRLAFHIDYAWRSQLTYTVDTVAAGQPAAVQQAYAVANYLGVIPSYGLANARITLNLDHPDAEIALWGRNILNKQYYIQQFDEYTGLGVAEDFQGDPRTFGATFTYRFK
jgi:iron complex outermembrane receptor protein